MSRTFSPAPWEAGFPEVRDANGGTVCDVRHAGTHNGNEFLIAAAPDLLAACEAAEHDLDEAIQRLPARFCDREDYQQCKTLLSQLREAIAKAKGGPA